jgi:hypothetical protein
MPMMISLDKSQLSQKLALLLAQMIKLLRHGLLIFNPYKLLEDILLLYLGNILFKFSVKAGSQGKYFSGSDDKTVRVW